MGRGASTAISGSVSQAVIDHKHIRNGQLAPNSSLEHEMMSVFKSANGGLQDPRCWTETDEGTETRTCAFSLFSITSTLT
jgi:hypothetical protein